MRGIRRRHAVMALALGLFLVGPAACGDDDDETTSPTTTSAASEDTTTTRAEPAEQTEVRAYFLRDEKVGPVSRLVTADDLAAAAVEAVLDGPTAAETEVGLSTTIPEGTDLLGVEVASGVATVDLSGEFASGGGSASMIGRVAQVVFTLTQFPEVDAVSFELDGAPLTELGGEGLLLDGPQSRADWEDSSPAILVESPLPFAEVTSPLHITGTANTFEAAFHVTVTDGEGEIVYDEPAMATSGTGTRGTFDVTATFEVPRAGLGELIVFEESANDGSRINLVEIPISVSG